MSFEQKDWKDRIAEYINRRRLTHEDGSTELVEVARDEGNISQEGDAFNAETMNDLEERIAEALKPLDTMEKIEANTQENQLAGALAVKELKNNTLPLSGGTMSGNIQGKDGGAFCTNGNVKLNTGDWDEWLSNILTSITERFDDVGSNISISYVGLGIDGRTDVRASLSMIKLSRKRANIIINYKIYNNNSSATNYEFIDMNKLKSVLGISSLAFAPGATTVIFKPVMEISNNELHVNTGLVSEGASGYTGLLFGMDGGIGRVYDEAGNYGNWSLNTDVYRVGSFGTIIINGADIG